MSRPARGRSPITPRRREEIPAENNFKLPASGRHDPGAQRLRRLCANGMRADPLERLAGHCSSQSYNA
eukprot:2544203-Alexandrium_andersonii.AAC.1